MNVIISGAYNESLLVSAQAILGSSKVVRLHESAFRLDDVADTETTRSEVKALCSTAKVDYGFVGEMVTLSKIRLLALDMDSTLIDIECIDELADFAGRKSEVADITQAAMEGKIDFSESLKRRVALLRGLESADLKCVFDERLHLSQGATALIDVAHKHHIYTLLVSGGFSYFTERLAISLEIDAAFANTLEIVDDRVTGRLILPILDAASKARHVTQAMERLCCGRDAAIAIGDGANDIAMMNCVEHSIAYHAKSPVVEIASLAIKYGTLHTALDFFSYPPHLRFERH